jgi:hypothetical protein
VTNVTYSDTRQPIAFMGLKKREELVLAIPA